MGVPILWRPFHEGEGSWFWWGSKGAETLKKLWRLMFDRYVNHHGLHNLLWVWNSPDPATYPGDDTVDIISRDIYPDKHSHTSLGEKYRELLRITKAKKVALIGENGARLEMQACSIGGGAIEVHKINGIDVLFTGAFNTLVIHNHDEYGTLAAVTTILSQLHINVANMSLNRSKRGGDALMVLETDQHIKPSQVDFLRDLPGILSLTYYDKEDEEYGFSLRR